MHNATQHIHPSQQHAAGARRGSIQAFSDQRLPSVRDLLGDYANFTDVPAYDRTPSFNGLMNDDVLMGGQVPHRETAAPGTSQFTHANTTGTNMVSGVNLPMPRSPALRAVYRRDSRQIQPERDFGVYIQQQNQDPFTDLTDLDLLFSDEQFREEPYEIPQYQPPVAKRESCGPLSQYIWAAGLARPQLK